MDLRCGFNKDYLTQGELEDHHISRVSLRGGDGAKDCVTCPDYPKVEMHLNFGCAVYVYKDK